MKVLKMKEMSILLEDEILGNFQGVESMSKKDIKRLIKLSVWGDLIQEYEIEALGQYLLANSIVFKVRYGFSQTVEEAIESSSMHLEYILQLNESIEYVGPPGMIRLHLC